MLIIWITPEEIEKIEKAQEENGCPNRSEFVRDAVKFYIGYNILLLVPYCKEIISFFEKRNKEEKRKNLKNNKQNKK